MRIIALKTLKEFWELHPDVEQPLRAWHDDAKRAAWEKPADITAKYVNARAISDNRVIFNVRGNKYRLIVKIHYQSGIVFIRFVGAHSEYDKIDATII
jgi:mRNA interferase HigB